MKGVVLKRKVIHLIQEKVCVMCKLNQPISNFYVLDLKNRTNAFCKTCLKDKDGVEQFRKSRRLLKEVVGGLLICFKCEEKKEVVEFYKNKKSKNGYSSYCKKCTLQVITRTQKNINLRLIGSMRSRINILLRGKDRSKRSLQILGCSVIEWKAHLESKFKPGMTWENYGSVWEIDHIKPLSKALEQGEKFLYKAFHYTNTEPLFKSENRKKSNKVLMAKK
jgi:hypothetical protein